MRNVFFVTIIYVLIIAACGSKESESQEATAEEKIDTAAVRIAVMPTLDCLPLFVAKEHGLFEKSGLKIALTPFTAQMDVDTALLGGSVKGAVTDVFRAARINTRKKLIYVTSTEAKWSLISNRNARLNKLEQFGDKMIAMTRYSATDYLTDATFMDVKTTAPYFKIQINDVDLRMNMLLNNEMDAAWLVEPQATKAERNGHKRLKTNDSNKYGVLVFSSNFFKKKLPNEFVDKLKHVYSESCDSINKYGIANYAAEMQKYCRVDTGVINAMPHIVFTHAEEPKQQVIDLAKSNATKK